MKSGSVIFTSWSPLDKGDHERTVDGAKEAKPMRTAPFNYVSGKILDQRSTNQVSGHASDG